MKRKPSILVIFLSVFIDLIGFGIVLPLLPGYAEDNFRPDFSAKGLVIGGIIASFSAMQFFFAPVWGRLSDRIGRRPVMLISNLGAAGSYALFAIACSMTGTNGLIWILISRVFAGICGANLSVASAYIADISPPEKRSARMGLIGMAFGLGFIFGPAIGAFSVDLFGRQGPGWVAACFCAGNFILGWFILGESRQPSSAPVTPRPKMNQWSHTLAQPKLGVLVFIFFLATFCFTCFEATFPLLARHEFGFGAKGQDHRIGYLFTYCGVIAAIIQGGLIGKLVKKLGEAKLIFVSLLVFCRRTWRNAICDQHAGIARDPGVTGDRFRFESPARVWNDFAKIIGGRTGCQSGRRSKFRQPGANRQSHLCYHAFLCGCEIALSHLWERGITDRCVRVAVPLPE
ncbi:MAG: MFS transporter [Limisphaerales bacterium]